MLKPGTILQDRYVIVDMLAEGGMGEVYRAEYTNLRGRYVAVKASKIDASNEMLRRQFEKEAVLLFDLKHGALPKVFDLFADERGQFLVMEFIDGRDLARVLEERGGPIDLDTAMHWADQLLDALEYLHERTPPVVHRDIKPQNIKLTTDGRVVLLDFGLAKSTGNLNTITTKSVHGHTPEYAPIEQVHGEGTDERSDIYSLAATLYTLLAYRPPARAPMRASAALEGRPDPLVPLPQINPGVPVEVWEVLQWGMSLMREKRPQSARAMRRALHDSLRGTGILAQPARSQGGNAGDTWVEGTAELWIGNTNPQAGKGGSSSQRGYARPTVAQDSGHSGPETSYSAPTADTLMPPEAFARTELDNRAIDSGYGPRPGETALSTEMLGNETIVDVPVSRDAVTIAPPDEFVTRVSKADALTGAGFSKEAPTISIKDAVNRSADTIAVEFVDPLRTSETPKLIETPTSPTDRVLAAQAPRAAALSPSASAVQLPEEKSGSGKWIVLGAVVVLIVVAAVVGFVVVPRLGQPWGQPAAPPVSETPVAPPIAEPLAKEPAPVAAPVDVLSFRIETMTGAPLPVASGAFPKDADFRIRYTPTRDGRFYVIVVNPDRSQTLFLSDKPAAQAKVASNVVRAGTEYVFPGPGVPMWFQTGTERLILVFAPDGANVPPAATGPALEKLPADVASMIFDRAGAASARFEWGRRGDAFAIRTISGAADGDLVVLDVNEISKTTAVFSDADQKPPTK